MGSSGGGVFDDHEVDFRVFDVGCETVEPEGLGGRGAGWEDALRGRVGGEAVEEDAHQGGDVGLGGRAECECHFVGSDVLSGCWTCRIRRKRCDETQPICRVCRTLHIDCVYAERKPEWMDSGRKQKDRMETIKAQVKENASHRRERQVLQSMDEPFIITSGRDFKASSVQRQNATTAIDEDRQVLEVEGEVGLPDGDRDQVIMGVDETVVTVDRAEIEHEPSLTQAIWLDAATIPGLGPPRTSPVSSSSLSALSTLVDAGATQSRRTGSAKPEALSFPPSDHELSSLYLGRETETEFLMMWLDYVFPFIYPFYRPPMLESGRHWVLNLLRTNQVAFHTAVSLGSYFFTIALGDTILPEQRRTCRSLLWGQLARQTSLALKRMSEDMAEISRRGPSDNLLEAARVVGSIIQQITVEVTIKRSADWSLHLNPTIALFKDMFAHHGTGPSGHPDLVHLLNQMPDPPMAMVGDNPLPHTADRTAFSFFTAVLVYIDVLGATSLDQPAQLAGYHEYLLLAGISTSQPPVRMELVFGCQNFVFTAMKDTAALSAWKKASKAAGELSVVDLVQRAAAISADLEAGLTALDAGSATFDPPVGVSLAGHFKGYYRRLERRKQDHKDIEAATRIWALAARVYLAVVVSGWQPASAGVRADVGRALELLGEIEEPGRIRSFAWPLCVVGCMAEPGGREEEVVRELAGRMGDLKEFGTVGQVMRVVEAVWSSTGSVDRDSWDVAACLNVLGSPALLI
ncbi:fungal-specific transcription factor domain-containing protein [Coniochaeta sp. 2T2.1]|nr:fungal-specific transcription factor domain-containing protein [Coniochaeta sp. 2T2.1]